MKRVKRPLEPKDFPVHAEKSKIIKNDGEPIADAKNDEVAEDVCNRLNADEERSEEDRWA
jgi:hypothetical protein